MATHHVVIISGDRIVNEHSDEEIGRALRAVIRTSGFSHEAKATAGYLGIHYISQSMDGPARALELALNPRK